MSFQDAPTFSSPTQEFPEGSPSPSPLVGLRNLGNTYVNDIFLIDDVIGGNATRSLSSIPAGAI